MQAKRLAHEFNHDLGFSSKFRVNSELVADNDAVGADGPAVAFGHEESVEVVLGGALLFDPGAALV